MSKFIDLLFICSAIIFNVSVSCVYIATKLDNIFFIQLCGGIVVFLVFPFMLTLYLYMIENAEKKVLVSNIIILFYLFLELLLDYILKIPFREILAIHIPYILIFYAAAFSMIGVSFDKNKKFGFIVLITFFILLGCLSYLYIC